MADEKPTASSSGGAVVPEKKKSNKVLWIVLGLVLFFFVIVPGLIFGGLALFLSSDKGTEKLTESIIEGATGNNVDVDTEKGSVSVKNDEGDSVNFGSGQELPSDFPKEEIPYIKEDEVTFVLTNSDENGSKSWSVSTTVSESLENALKFFEDKIKAPDYSSTASYGFGTSKTFTGKSATYDVSVTVSKPDDGKTTITYVVSEN